MLAWCILIGSCGEKNFIHAKFYERIVPDGFQENVKGGRDLAFVQPLKFEVHGVYLGS